MVVDIKLLVYHFYLVYKNLTTYQDIKKSYKNDIDTFFVSKLKIKNNKINEFITQCCKNICINPKPTIPWFNPSDIYKVNYTHFDIDSKQETENKSKSKTKNYINNSTNPKTVYNAEYKMQPGEIHFSDNEIDNVMLNEGSRINNNNLHCEITTLDNNNESKVRDESLNKRIFSIINSSGTLEDDENKSGKII